MIVDRKFCLQIIGIVLLVGLVSDVSAAHLNKKDNSVSQENSQQSSESESESDSEPEPALDIRTKRDGIEHEIGYVHRNGNWQLPRRMPFIHILKEGDYHVHANDPTNWHHQYHGPLCPFYKQTVQTTTHSSPTTKRPNKINIDLRENGHEEPADFEIIYQ